MEDTFLPFLIILSMCMGKNSQGFKSKGSSGRLQNNWSISLRLFVERSQCFSVWLVCYWLAKSVWWQKIVNPSGGYPLFSAGYPPDGFTMALWHSLQKLRDQISNKQSKTLMNLLLIYKAYTWMQIFYTLTSIKLCILHELQIIILYFTYVCIQYTL